MKYNCLECDWTCETGSCYADTFTFKKIFAHEKTHKEKKNV